MSPLLVDTPTRTTTIVGVALVNVCGTRKSKGVVISLRLVLPNKDELHVGSSLHAPLIMGIQLRPVQCISREFPQEKLGTMLPK